MVGHLILALAAVALSGYAVADSFDPTRPPAGYYQAKPGDLEAQQRLVVTSMILHPDQSYALVGNRVVKVGDVLDEGRVIKIDQYGIWLKTRHGIEQIKLLPGVSKRPASAQKSKLREQ